MKLAIGSVALVAPLHWVGYNGESALAGSTLET